MYQLEGSEVEKREESIARTAEPHCFARLMAVPTMVIVRWCLML